MIIAAGAFLLVVCLPIVVLSLIKYYFSKLTIAEAWMMLACIVLVAIGFVLVSS